MRTLMTLARPKGSRPTRTPNGIRTRVTALKGRRPRPLDDGGSTDRGEARLAGWLSRPLRLTAPCRTVDRRFHERPCRPLGAVVNLNAEFDELVANLIGVRIAAFTARGVPH